MGVKPNLADPQVIGEAVHAFVTSVCRRPRRLTAVPAMTLRGGSSLVTRAWRRASTTPWAWTAWGSTLTTARLTSQPTASLSWSRRCTSYFTS